MAVNLRRSGDRRLLGVSTALMLALAAGFSPPSAAPVEAASTFINPLPASSTTQSYACYNCVPEIPSLANKYHTGIDLAGGTAVVAPADGVVIFKKTGCKNQGEVGYDKTCGDGYGNYVDIEFTLADNSKRYGRFGHLSDNDAAPSSGCIKQGAALGPAGKTGNVTGVHLHWAMRANTSDWSGYTVSHPDSHGFSSPTSYYSQGFKTCDDGGGGADVAMALIVDSSGSMDWNDPEDRRKDAARAYVGMLSQSDDEAGVIDFDDNAVIASPMVPIAGNVTALNNAIATIDSVGGTNLGDGLDAGCAALGAATTAQRAAIFLTDGDGSYNNNAQCYIDNGWPIFAIGLGDDVDEALLRQIATSTNGQYFALDTTTNIVCEFQQLRALVAGLAHSGCEPTDDIVQDQIITIVETIARYMGQVTFTNTWLGSDIEMTIISPSGTRYDRQTTASDAIVVVGDTFETITILEPEPGEWTVEFFGADIPDGGEPFNFSTVQLPADPVDPTVVSPARLLESRIWSRRSVDGSFEGIGRRGAGSVTELEVAGSWWCTR